MADFWTAFPRPLGSFNEPVPIPSSEPDEGMLVSAHFALAWQALLCGAIDQLCLQQTWLGTDDENKSARQSGALLKELIGAAQPEPAETPFWDTDEDVGAVEAEDVQTWYGVVTDILAPPDGITFEENLQIWTFAGLLAIAGEVGAAISFITIAPKFVIAIKGRDVGEIIRIIVDAQDVASVDTTGHAGEVINTNVVADPANDTHQIYLVKVS